jgi:hypothetical protein
MFACVDARVPELEVFFVDILPKLTAQKKDLI